MHTRLATLLLTGLLLAGLLPFASPSEQGSTVNPFAAAPAQARNGDPDQKDAFDAAKDLGTIEAWEAFLKSYPKGFYADLARAYVRKLGASSAAPRKRQPARTRSQPKPQARLTTVTAEPGTTPWRLRSFETDDGNTREMAAAVASDGVELLFYCAGKQRLTGIIRESKRGQYPKFDERIRQGLAAKGADTGEPALIPMRFSDGTVYSVSASVQEMTGDVSLAQDADGSGFRAAGNFVSDLMTGQSVSIEAPPFAATLQLKKSSKALCSVINKCGAKVARCKTYTKRKKKYKKQRKRKTNRANSPYHDSQGKLLDGYIYDKDGNVTQDNGGGE